MCLISGTLRSTPLPWLPVLSNIEPPALQRKAATDKPVEKIVKHDSWPIQPDILSPSLLRLTYRKPLWLDLQPVDIKSQWRTLNWKLAQVVNSHLVCDPTIQQPGFDLPQQQWSLLNRFCMEQGHCGACRRNGDLQTLICVLVARPRRCLTLLNPVPWQNWMVANLGYTLQMKMLFRGWPVMVYDTHTRRRRRLEYCVQVWCKLIWKWPRNTQISGVWYHSCQFWWHYNYLFPIYGLLGVMCVDCLSLSINWL